MSNSYCGIQVVSVLEDHTYQLEEDLLEQLLLRQDVRNLPVVVVSVAGAYRGGKSFLLNFFIRYLTASRSAQDDGSWLNDDCDCQSQPLIGFSWRGGVERNTTGILLWSEPFITTLPSGEKVVVLLMDTQGTFDSDSTVRDNSTIFALSTLVSSVQIYNLSNNIQEDDLQHLQLFTMYGKMVLEKNENEKPFQTLGFLVRDWPYPNDYPFGAKGGQRLLQKRLKVTQKQPEELRELRNHLHSCFEDVFCFLMPHPGFKVQDPCFNGHICDIEINFCKYLKIFVPMLLSPENLCPKTINGQRIKARELFNYFKSYMTIFNSDQIPTPKSIAQATAEAGLLSAESEAREVYEREMDAACGPTQPGVPQEYLQDIHRKCLDAARDAFNNKKIMASQAEISKHLDKLIQDLDNRLPQFEQSNLLKLQTAIMQASDLYEDVINNISKGQQLNLHPLDLDTVHEEAVQAALKLYDEQVKVISDKEDQKKAELIQNLQNRHVELVMINDNNNKAAVQELFTDYQILMTSRLTNPPLSEADFKECHDVALIHALDTFKSKRNRFSSYLNDIYCEELEKIILESFCQLQTVNNDKIEQERINQRNLENLQIQTNEVHRLAAENQQLRCNPNQFVNNNTGYVPLLPPLPCLLPPPPPLLPPVPCLLKLCVIQ